MEAGSLWLSVDWGTSNFRLRLIDGASLRMLGEVTSPKGVSVLFREWNDRARIDPLRESPEARIAFYKQFLLEQIHRLQAVAGTIPANAPVILSGMASSTIGMMVLPYRNMPCPADGSGLTVFTAPATTDFPFPLALVSGVCNTDDVMRGEETMLIGAAAGKTNDNGSGWYILPGTHSKHILVDNGQLVNLRTYMTGEIFALLSEKSILSGSLENAGALSHPDVFRNGLTEGFSGRLLHSLFTVRTAELLGRFTKTANYCFLSGLVIGHELKDLEGADKLTLVGSGPLMTAYEAAIGHLFPDKDPGKADGAAVLIHGQWQIAVKIF